MSHHFHRTSYGLLHYTSYLDIVAAAIGFRHDGSISILIQITSDYTNKPKSNRCSLYHGDMPQEDQNAGAQRIP
jgi:hypothetical protein